MNLFDFLRQTCPFLYAVKTNTHLARNKLIASITGSQHYVSILHHGDQENNSAVVLALSHEDNLVYRV